MELNFSYNSIPSAGCMGAVDGGRPGRGLVVLSLSPLIAGSGKNVYFLLVMMDRKRMTVILRSALMLVTVLLIFLVVLNPIVTALLLVAGVGLLGVLALKGRRFAPIHVEQRHFHSLPPGRSPPFFF